MACSQWGGTSGRLNVPLHWTNGPLKERSPFSAAGQWDCCSHLCLLKMRQLYSFSFSSLSSNSWFHLSVHVFFTFSCFIYDEAGSVFMLLYYDVRHPAEDKNHLCHPQAETVCVSAPVWPLSCCCCALITDIFPERACLHSTCSSTFYFYQQGQEEKVTTTVLCEVCFWPTACQTD